MSEWPIPIIKPCVTIIPWSLESISAYLSGALTTFTGLGSSTYPTANLALFIPFVLSMPVTAVKMFAYNGATVSGNIDLGLYDTTGIRLVSIGSTAQAGTGATQEFNITDTNIGPGRFYLAVAMNNTTGTLYRGTMTNAAILQSTGMSQMATAFPLPATATLAAVSVNYVPLIALTTRTVV